MNSPALGDTLDLLVRERAILCSVRDLVKRRIDLEKEYLQKLRYLRQGITLPDQPTLKALVSSLLQFLDIELAQKMSVNEDLNTYLASLSFPEPGAFEYRIYVEPRYDHSELRRAHQMVEKARQWAQLDLGPWGTDLCTRIEPDNDQHHGIHLRLSESDCSYRNSVLEQHKHAQIVSKWHDDVLPTRIEEHQQLAEDAKLLIDRLTLTQSELSSHLVVGFSSVLNAVAKVKPSEFIATHYDLAERERQCSEFQPVEYRKQSKDNQLCYPIFCASSILDIILEYFSPRVHSLNFSADTTILIETAHTLERTRYNQPLSTCLGSADEETCFQYFAFALLSLSRPLLPLINRPKANLGREKIEPIFFRYTRKSDREAIGILLARHVTNLRDTKMLSILLTQAYGNWPILRNIWRKWDFLTDRPLPDGIIRVIFQKDLETYVLQKSSAPVERRGEEFILRGEASVLDPSPPQED